MKVKCVTQTIDARVGERERKRGSGNGRESNKCVEKQAERRYGALWI